MRFVSLQNLKWKYYYRYKVLNEVDVDGPYSTTQKILLFLNITKTNLFGDYLSPKHLEKVVEKSPQKISDTIYSVLSSEEPCMIARFGANEQRITANYLSISDKERHVLDGILGRRPFWWWDKQVRKEFNSNAGFFPNDSILMEKYAHRMMYDTESLDVLMTWFGWEHLLLGDNHQVELVGLQEAEPWWQAIPWTRYLKGKKVLVVHPFAELIEKQYKNRIKLFDNGDVLPEFELVTLKSVQSIGGKVVGYANWFEALEWMEREMDKVNYDVALIGCGAYGFCLAAHAKRMGKKAVHLGGVLQLLFGIKGNRWENKNYHQEFDYTKLFNNYWVRPDDKLRPKDAEQYEGACYW